MTPAHRQRLSNRRSAGRTGGVTLAAAMLLSVVSAFGAQPRYDVKLERAVMALIAAHIGELRLSLDYDADPFAKIDETKVAEIPAEAPLFPAHKNWRIAIAPPPERVVVIGSVQTFSTGLDPRPEPTDTLYRKPVALLKTY